MSKRRYTHVLVAFGFAALAASPATAQTTANGPYYAVPSWDQTLPASTRFIVLSNMASEAVLDRETGIVWERSPSPEAINGESAAGQCAGKLVGNRMGWRLATVQELTSLIDRSVPASSALKLPVGHPFLGTAFAPDAFWSATARSAFSGVIVGFVSGLLGTANKSIFSFPVWCVRGGNGLDQQ